MRIPWTPITQGNGSFGPDVPTAAFMKNYSTASNPVSHKAFQNLPMNTEAPAVIVKKPNKDDKKTLQSSKIRTEETEGNQYAGGDVFLHPIKGNYQQIIAQMEIQTLEKRMAPKEQYPTLLSLVESGYTNVGRNADEEFQNSVRDKLRQAGASDEEIEVIIKEARIRRLRELSQREATEEEFQRRIMLGLIPTLQQKTRGPQDKPIARADQNVFNFGNPTPLLARQTNTVAVPGNEIFAGRRSAGVNPPGAPSLEGVMGRLSQRAVAERTLQDIIMAASGRSRVEAAVAEPRRTVARIEKETARTPQLAAPQRAPTKLFDVVSRDLPMTELQRRVARGETIRIPKQGMNILLQPLREMAKEPYRPRGSAPMVVLQSDYAQKYAMATRKGEKQRITRQAKLEAMID